MNMNPYRTRGVRLVLTSLALLAALPLAFVQPTPATAAAPTHASGPLADRWSAIDAYVEQERQAARIPGIALGIVQGDRVVHQQGFGVADPSGRAVTPQTPFRIGSTAKSMTATAIMQLVEQGTLDLDAPIQRYLAWFTLADPAAAARITVRHLLTHTSGLARQTGTAMAANRADTADGVLERQVRAWHTADVTTAPGTTYEYNNANYVLLGLLVETLSGQSFERYLHEQIFAPLAMDHTTVGPAAGAEPALAVGYRYWFGLPRPADIDYGRAINPAGGVSATVEDMTHYLIAQLNGGRYGTAQLLTPATIATMHQPAVPIPAERLSPGFSDAAYGLGWMPGTRDGVSVVAHPGDLPTYHSDIQLLPQEQIGIVLLMNANNRQTGERMRALVNGVTSLMLGQDPASVETGGGLALLIFRVVMGIALLHLGFIAWSARRLWRWGRAAGPRPQGGWGIVRRLMVPLGFHLLLALVFLGGLPLLFNLPLALLVESQPDLGLVAIGSGVVALIWAGVRTVVVSRVLRRPAVVAPAGMIPAA